MQEDNAQLEKGRQFRKVLVKLCKADDWEFTVFVQKMF